MWVKYLNKSAVKRAPLNLKTDDKTILNFRFNPELMRKYGFKPLTEVEKDYNRSYRVEYEEAENEIREVVIYDPLVNDDPAADAGGNTTSDPEFSEQGGDINGEN